MHYIHYNITCMMQMLSDGVLDEEEALELRDALREWVGGGVLHGEEATSASLPPDHGERTISIHDSVFVFTGKGVYGSRARAADRLTVSPTATLNSKTRAPARRALLFMR